MNCRFIIYPFHFLIHWFSIRIRNPWFSLRAFVPLGFPLSVISSQRWSFQFPDSYIVAYRVNSIV